MNTNIKILIVEHDSNDLELLQYELKKGGIGHTAEIVANKEDYTRALKNFVPDIILSDYSLPEFDGPSAFILREELAPETPFIFVSGNIGEEISIEYIKRGLTDYVLKDKLFTLTTKVKRALKDGREKKQKRLREKEREQNEVRLKDAQAIARIGSWEIDMVSNSQTWSDGMFTIYGAEKNETRPSVESYLSFVHPDDLVFVKEKVTTAFNLLTDSSYDFRFIRRDGVVRYAYAKSHFEFDKDRRPVKRYGIIQDITEKKHDEDKIKKSNRLYTFISQINQSIVHLKDDESLFRNACRIALEYGKFKMAWIGLFDADREKVTLIDHGGIPREEIKLFMDISCEADGPQYHVLHTDTYYICNEIEGCYELRSWLPFAAKHGIRSCLVLPIKKSGSTIGTFNLYASDPDFFDTSEIELLKEVVGDISFALTTFEKAKLHRKTEELVIKNEKRFRGLIEKSSDIITLSTFQEAIYASPSITNVLGYSVEEFLLKRVPDLIHPDDMPVPSEIQKLFSAPGQSISLQQRMLHKDGRWIWLEGTITNMLHEPAVNALVSNFRDISERKLAEQNLVSTNAALQRALNDLQKTMDSSLDVICSMDGAGKFVNVSAASAWVWGYMPHELIGKPFIDFVFHDDTERTINQDQEIMKGAPVTMFENRCVRKDGTIVPILWSARWDDKDKLLYCIAKDATEKKKSEQQWEFDKNNLNALINNTTDLMWSVDRNFKLITSNRAFDEMVKHMSGDIVSKGIDTLNIGFKKETLLRFKGHYERASLGEAFTEIEYNDPPFESWSEISYYPIYKKREVVGTACFSRNITERKKAENDKVKTLEQVKRLSIVASKTDNSVLILDKQARIEWVNNSFTRLTGYSLEESVTRQPLDLLHGPETDPVTERKIIEKSKALQPFTDEIINYAKDGKKYWVRISVTPVLNKLQELDKFVVIQSDVSEQKEFEKKITAIARELTSLIENANVPIFGIDRNGYINEWNRIAEELSEYKKNDVYGRKWKEFWTTNTHDELNGIIENVLNGVSTSNCELSFPSKSGKKLITLTSISPRMDNDRQIKGAIFVGQDISEVIRYRQDLEKMVEERTRELNEALQKEKHLVEMKNKFVSIASHEFRTPLSTISLAAESIRNYFHKLTAEEIQRKLIKIEDQASHMTNLLEDILTLGKSDAGKIKVKRISLDLKEFIGSLIEEVRATVKEKRDIRFTFSCANSKVSADDKLLRNVINNLLTNALKFSDFPTPITVDVSDCEGDVLLEVTDEGIGIDESELSAVFESFQRGSNVSTIQGTGLGLSILKKAVELMHGTIKVKSSLNKGSTFSVQIPLK